MSSFFSVCTCSSSLVLVQYFQPDLFLSFSASHSETSINSVYQILRLLAWLFIYQSSITSQILDFIYWMVTIFIFDAWHDSANQQFFVTLFVLHGCGKLFRFFLSFHFFLLRCERIARLVDKCDLVWSRVKAGGYIKRFGQISTACYKPFNSEWTSLFTMNTVIDPWLFLDDPPPN